MYKIILFFSGVLIGFLTCTIIASCLEYVYYTSKPSAMDVYQGKTTLEITYIDSVAIDSVVVFKNKEKLQNDY